MILVSAGHHPYAKGASYKDFNEFDEAKLWVPIITNHLGRLGMAVPVGVLREKVNFINEIDDVQCAIEIHFNMAWRDKNKNNKVDDDEFLGKGCETLYYPGSVAGKELAEKVQSELSNVFGPDRGVKEGWYRLNKNNGPDFFLARTKCPSIIIEPEFVHNAEKIKEGRPAGCAVIASVLLDIFGE